MWIGQNQGQVTSTHLRMAAAGIGALESKTAQSLHQLTPGDRTEFRHGQSLDRLGNLVQIDPG
jgi:hypothetical protein